MKVWLGRMLYYAGLPAFMVYLSFRRSARVIVEHDGTYLLVRPWVGSGTWLLPGGGIWRGEPAAETAARELHEETGIAIEPDEFVLLGEFRCQHGRCLFSHDQVFWCIVPSTELAPPHGMEIAAIAWQPFDVMQAACGNAALMHALQLQRSKAGLV